VSLNGRARDAAALHDAEVVATKAVAHVHTELLTAALHHVEADAAAAHTALSALQKAHPSRCHSTSLPMRTTTPPAAGRTPPPPLPFLIPPYPALCEGEVRNEVRDDFNKERDE
jgi:hypothetical protein